MLKKELLETLRQTAIVLCFALAIPIMYMVNEARLVENEAVRTYIDFGVTSLFTLLALSLYWNMFAQEEREGAMEYIRSLPFPRMKLLALKVLPRLAVLLLALTAATLNRINWLSLMGISWIPLTVLLLSGFMMGISDRRNPVLALLLLMPAFHWLLSGQLAAHKMLSALAFIPNLGAREAILVTEAILWIIPTILPVTLLLPLYLKWQSCSGKELAQQMLKRLIAPTVLLIGIAVFAFS